MILSAARPAKSIMMKFGLMTRKSIPEERIEVVSTLTRGITGKKIF